MLRPDPERPEQREVEAAAIAAYRNIAREQKHLIDILYIGRGRDFLYYIMPLADSERDPRCRYKPRTLAGEIGREGSSTREKLRVVNEIIEGVAFLHAHGLAHRDLKPENILFVGGVLKVADPGLVSEIGRVNLSGTPGFAPEFPLDGRDADIYAIGKIIYTLFTGLAPEDFPELPRSWRTMFHSRLNRIILKCCAESESLRYSDISLLAADVSALCRPSPLRRGWNLFRSAAPWLLLALIALPAVFLGVVLALREFIPMDGAESCWQELLLLRRGIRSSNVIRTKLELDRIRELRRELFEIPENATFYDQVGDNAQWLRAFSADNNDFAAMPLLVDMSVFSDAEKEELLREYLPTLSGEPRLRVLVECYRMARRNGRSHAAGEALRRIRNTDVSRLNRFAAAMIFLRMSNLLTLEGRCSEALGFIERARQLMPHLSAVYLMKFQACYISGDLPRAREALDELCRVSPGCVAVPRCFRMLSARGMEF